MNLLNADSNTESTGNTDDNTSTPTPTTKAKSTAKRKPAPKKAQAKKPAKKAAKKAAKPAAKKPAKKAGKKKAATKGVIRHPRANSKLGRARSLVEAEIKRAGGLGKVVPKKVQTMMVTRGIALNGNMAQRYYYMAVNSRG